MAAKRKRNVPLQFYVTPEERGLIQRRMEDLGTKDMSGYLRKMAVDGRAIRVEAPELGELVRLLGYAGNNLNQLTRRLRASGKIYDADLETLSRDFSRLVEMAEDVSKTLGRLDKAREG